MPEDIEATLSDQPQGHRLQMLVRSLAVLG